MFLYPRVYSKELCEIKKERLSILVWLVGIC